MTSLMFTTVVLVLFVCFATAVGEGGAVRSGVWGFLGEVDLLPDPTFHSVEQCIVYCSGEILTDVQNAILYPDSKTFVDMPMKYNPATVLSSFNNITNKNRESLLNFMSEYFSPAGSELVNWVPPDFVEFPPFISKIADVKYRAFAQILNEMWTSLGKQLDPDVALNPQRYSMIPQKNPFIVPGSRFHEFYYWDSYWIIQGLLTCGMNQTAKGIILNALDLVNDYGFVPNGARVYYLNRSQPPLLSEMVLYYYQITNDLDLVQQSLPMLEIEYQYWMKTKHLVQLEDGLALNRYYSSNVLPRPESFREDSSTTANMSNADALKFFSNIVAGAESGEDFTDRWFSSGSQLETISTINIIPVDLNAILYKFESNMIQLYQYAGKQPPIDFAQAMERRKIAMDRYLFNASDSQWHDYCITNASQLIKAYPSNWFPLWSGAYNQSDEKFKNDTVFALLKSGLIQAGGVLCSTSNSGQQWDSPNAWAPHQSLLVHALQAVNTPHSIELAQTIAWNWIQATYIGYQKSGFMQEKYNGFIPGDPGQGGEYPNQKGFGWTNGVTLEFLSLYGNQ